MQVLCRVCHDEKHPNLRFPRESIELLEAWITPEEVMIEERVDHLWEEVDLEEDAPDDELAQEIVEWEMLYDLGLDPDDPDFSELAAEGLEGNEDGNYDDERDDRAGDDDPADQEQDEDDLDDDEDDFDDVTPFCEGDEEDDADSAGIDRFQDL
jgi:hypothetical protein